MITNNLAPVSNWITTLDKVENIVVNIFILLMVSIFFTTFVRIKFTDDPLKIKKHVEFLKLTGAVGCFIFFLNLLMHNLIVPGIIESLQH